MFYYVLDLIGRVCTKKGANAPFLFIAYLSGVFGA